jgi:hypothetical protein
MKVRTALIVAATVLGLAAPAASAHVRPRSYRHTYPVASALCTRVANGHAPKRLSADVPQITAACNTLGNSYTQAVGTYETAIAPIAGDVATTLAGVRTARLTATQTGDWAAYRATVKQARLTLKGLRLQVRAAKQSYVASIRAARQTFWSTIHALRGAGSLPTDTGTPTAPPGPVVPTTP